MYLGGQADLLACTWNDTPLECGKHRLMYTFVMVTAICPLFLIPDFRKLGFFSTIVIFFCFSAIFLIIIFSISAIYARNQGKPYPLVYSDEDGTVIEASAEVANNAFNYIFSNISMIPLFMGEVISIFEGNSGILNIYSQNRQP